MLREALCVWLTVALCAVAGSAFAADRTYLGSFAVIDERAARSRSASATIRIRHRPGLSIGAQLIERGVAVASSDGETSFRTESYPTASAPLPSDAESSATLIIDFDEPVFEQLRTELIATYPDGPKPDDLARYAHDLIQHKNLQSGFDVASRVATRRAGDCTEHAVLLAALLRQFDWPARVILGVMIEPNETAGAFGHAWTEYFDGQRWQGLDATRPDEGASQWHVPLSVIDREGYDYAIGLIQAVTVLDIEQISILP